MVVVTIILVGIVVVPYSGYCSGNWWYHIAGIVVVTGGTI